MRVVGESSHHDYEEVMLVFRNYITFYTTEQLYFTATVSMTMNYFLPVSWSTFDCVP
jgi:hypothetical protein